MLFFYLSIFTAQNRSMLYRYFIELAYKGTNFHGWQIQPNANSVQETLEKALSLMLKSEVQLTGCGRTDTGVHAKYFVAHFNLSHELQQPERLAYKLNSYLAYDIVIFSITPVDPDLHARFSAVEREYEYHLMTVKDPFLTETTHYIHFIPDYKRMNRAAKLLLEHSDFTSFSKLHTDVKTNNCKILKAEWIKEGDDYWVFKIRADRFLRNMVRAIVGTLLEVGRNRLTEEGFNEVILSKNRSNAGMSVPGTGLFLSDVSYPNRLFTRKVD